jgi:hypothetical protein
VVLCRERTDRVLPGTCSKIFMHEPKRCGFILRAWFSIVYLTPLPGGTSVCRHAGSDGGGKELVCAPMFGSLL